MSGGLKNERTSISAESKKTKPDLVKLLLVASIVLVSGILIFVLKKYYDKKNEAVDIEKHRIEKNIDRVKLAVLKQDYESALSFLSSPDSVNWEVIQEGDNEYIYQYNIRRDAFQKNIMELKAQRDSLTKEREKVAKEMEASRAIFDSIIKAEHKFLASHNSSEGDEFLDHPIKKEIHPSKKKDLINTAANKYVEDISFPYAATVIIEKAYFHKEPNMHCDTVGVVEKNGIVNILAKESIFFKSICKEIDGTTITGWIFTSDVARRNH